MANLAPFDFDKHFRANLSDYMHTILLGFPLDSHWIYRSICARGNMFMIGSLPVRKYGGTFI